MSATPSIALTITYPGNLLKPSLLDIVIKGTSVFNPSGSSVGTTYDAWCLIEEIDLPLPATYTATIYSPYELTTLATGVPTLAASQKLANMDNINWLLNHYTSLGAAYGDVQGAIWKMMNSTVLVDYVGPQSMANIDALVAQAMQHDGYVPGIGDTIGVVIDTLQGSRHRQPLIIEMKAAALGDRVWHDANANGIQDAGETGIAGAIVELVRDQNKDGDLLDAGEVLATTTTDASGNYSFKGLTPGLNYQVRFTLPSGYERTSPRQSDGSAGSGANSDALLSNVVVLAPGENNTGIDAGFYKSASLGDRVWLDANGNGRQDAGELGVAGVKVTLLGGGADGKLSTTADNTSVEMLTDANGNYKFNGLTPGVEYQVRFDKPAGSVLTGQDMGEDAGDSDANSAGLSQIIKLASGENNTTIDAGIYHTASLGDRVWLDANGNGRQDAGEAGVAGAKVTLIGGGADGLLSTASDNTSVETTTDVNGNYKFEGLTPGTEYQVQFGAPAGHVFTSADRGDDSSDSDAAANGLSQVVKLASGENNTTIDAGVYVPASLGDRVWLDANGNGQQDDGETGVAGAKVTLIGGGADGKLATTGDNTSIDTTTDANGNYTFSGLVPGSEYQVRFDAPAGHVFTTADKGNDASDSDAGAGGMSQVVTLASGEHNTTIDAGIYKPASLGDIVWHDANANGQQDAGEAGIEGVQITLVGGGADGLVATTADNVTFTTTSGINGSYRFDGLVPGMEYQLSFGGKDGYVASGADIGDDQSDSDAGAAGKSQVLTLKSGEHDGTIDAGVYRQASLGDRVWLDADANGQQDANEAGIAGVKVTLVGGGLDGLVATTGDNTSVETITDANGNYTFGGLTPGVEYQVQFATPEGFVASKANVGNDASDSDAAAGGLSQIVTLTSGENNTTIDAGFYQTASLGDRVWVDANGNGQQDAGEVGVAGAKVALIGGGADGLLSTLGDNTSVDTVTDADGAYRFDGLAPGAEYQVQFTAPAGHVFTRANSGNDASDSDAGANGLSQVVKLGSGENNTTVDAGVYAPATLGDRVWLDANANGQQDDGETGVAGVKVTLIGGGADGLISTAGDNTSVETTTDANGSYTFEGLTPGLEYQVKFTAPSGAIFTAQDKGDDAGDSDADHAGLSQIVKLASGENNATIDAGIYTPASLGDRVWHDVNANGQQDAGETGIAGVKVTLVGGGADGLLSTLGDNTSVETTTDANGNYTFNGLTPATEYQVQFGAPDGFVATRAHAGNDSSDSDAVADLSQIVKLASGESNTTIDAGFYKTASLGDRVWVDANGNGQQDDGEAGVAGAKVTLIGGGADGQLATTGDNTSVETVTDTNGNYSFGGLTPDTEYQVQFSAPAGSVFTRSNSGNDASDSDAGAGGLSQVVKLASGENNTTVDAGVYAPATLGDRVWLDANANGQQDDGETGVAGVKVTLIGGGADGLISTAGDNTSVETTTDASGHYRFEGLTPGLEYQVKFGAPAGAVFTAQDKGNDASDSDAGSAGLSQIVKLASGENNATIDAGIYTPASLGDRVWHDANANGQQDDGETGIAGVKVTLVGGGADGLISTMGDNTSVDTTTDANGNYTFEGLTPGMEYAVKFGAPGGYVATGADAGNDVSDSDAGAGGLSQVVKLGSGEHNPTIDAGFYKTASLGDRVWVDANGNGQQDAGETGVAGARVTLVGGGADGLISTTADNTSVDTTTDANGNYKFDGLRPNTEYQVQFSAPLGHVFTRADQGSDTSDSDAGSTGLSQIVKLASGENNTTIDAGVYAPASLGDRVWVDANGNGQQDAGELGAAGVKVTLIGGGADGLVSTTGDNTSVETVTDANGNYRFEGLTPGREYQVQFAAPAGSVFTRANSGNDASDSDAGAGGLSQVVKLASGENNTTIDAGVYAPASLGDRVWVDANGNGQQDAGELGAAGVKVTLIGGGADGLVSTTADNTSVETTTDASGNYKFSGLTPGMEYQVQFGKPAGTVFTGQDKGNDASDSDANAVTGLSQVVKLAGGENNTTIDAGIYTPASLGNRVWLDANANGQQDAGETGVAGVTVTLTGGGADGLVSTTADNTTLTTTTDASGNYLFKDIVPGNQYQVTFGKPTDMFFTKKDVGLDASDSDADTVTGKSQVLTLKAGEFNDTIDAGIYANASIGDRLWIDTNANGLQDDGATGLAGRTVTLIGGGADGLISTTADNTSVSMLTGSDGAYNFSNLTPGVQYQVQFSKPTGYVYTGAGAGSDALDSDANASTGMTRIVTLGSGENNKNLDAGLVNVTGDLSITKTDGVSFVTPGQTITYKIVVTNTGTAVAANALVTDAIPSTLTNVTWTSSATSGASDNQASGTGSISDYVTLNGGSSITYTVTAKVASLAALETVSDFSTLGNNVGVGTTKTVNGVTADAAYISGGAIGSATLWARNSGEDKGLGVISRYEDSAGGEAVTGLSNQKNTDVIRLTKEAGDQWSSLWVSNLDAEGSGGAEIGTLYWSDNPMPDLSTLTTKFTFKYGDFGVGAESGDILSLRPSTFNADAKYVFFVAGNNPNGSNNDFLVWKAGTVPAQLSNTAKVTPPSTFVDTNSGNNSATDVDDINLPTPVAVKRGSIGDTVWEDNNYNGIRDSGEAGIKGVTVKLLDANGKVLETTVTDSNGKYLFDNLNAGSYRIEVTEPSGYFVTKQNVGSNDGIDSDIDTTAGRSGLISLDQGENDLTWDAGLYRKASLGDKVWEDLDHDDIQDSNEGGIGGVTVQLYTSSGTLLATTKTNSSGNYKFSNLDPGTYYLKFDKNDVIYKGINMDNWMWASKNIGSNDAIDSDVNGDGVSKVNVTRTDNITLSSGENDMSWDAAITPIAIDLNGDGVHTIARSASAATFDLLGTGTGIQSGWLSSNDGFLAVDRNGNGKIDGISELFGGAKQGAGFSQLAAYDSNHDGLVDAQDAAFGELRIWQDANGNHQTDDGELLSLAQAGVVSLKVEHVVLPFVDAQGNLHLERSSATLANGRVADMTDVYFAIDARDAQASGAPTMAELLAAVETDAAVPVAIVGQPGLVM